MRRHLTPAKMAMIKKISDKFEQKRRAKKPLYTVVGNVN